MPERSDRDRQGGVLNDQMARKLSDETDLLMREKSSKPFRDQGNDYKHGKIPTEVFNVAQ